MAWSNAPCSAARRRSFVQARGDPLILQRLTPAAPDYHCIDSKHRRAPGGTVDNSPDGRDTRPSSLGRKKPNSGCRSWLGRCRARRPCRFDACRAWIPRSPALVGSQAVQPISRSNQWRETVKDRRIETRYMARTEYEVNALAIVRKWN
jgi:hypothetical protein